MIAASQRRSEARNAKLLVIDRHARLTHLPRRSLLTLLETGDLLVANDAATIPASLFGTHNRTGAPIEVRLAGRDSLAADRVHEFHAVVFGDGDFRVRTEDRPAPPQLRVTDRLTLGPLRAEIVGLLHHPRLVVLHFDGDARAVWAGLAQHGRPIQYSHLQTPLAVWDTWTALAATPAAFEPPSAGFALDWTLLRALDGRGVRLATLTHAAGISSTGDPLLDAYLPFDEPYEIPLRTGSLIEETRRLGGRVIAVGTTVARALEHAALASGSVRTGRGVASQKIGVATTLRVIDAIVSGTHEPGTSHYELLRAFIDDDTLSEAQRQLDEHRYCTHEFGDSVFVENTRG